MSHFLSTNEKKKKTQYWHMNRVEYHLKNFSYMLFIFLTLHFNDNYSKFSVHLLWSLQNANHSIRFLFLFRKKKMNCIRHRWINNHQESIFVIMHKKQWMIIITLDLLHTNNNKIHSNEKFIQKKIVQFKCHKEQTDNCIQWLQYPCQTLISFHVFFCVLRISSNLY